MLSNCNHVCRDFDAPNEGLAHKVVEKESWRKVLSIKVRREEEDRQSNVWFRESEYVDEKIVDTAC